MYTIPTSGACAASSIAGTSSEKSGRRLTVLTAAPPTTASGADIEYPGEIGSTVFPLANVSTSARIASLDPLVTATRSGATPCDRANAPPSAAAPTGAHPGAPPRPPPLPHTPLITNSTTHALGTMICLCQAYTESDPHHMPYNTV